MNKSSLSRRSFIKGAAGAVGFGFVVPSTVFGAQAPSNQLRLGCIGVGRMGRENMMHALNIGLEKNVNACIAAVCDVDIKRAKHAKSDVEKKYAEYSKNNTVNSEKKFLFI